MYPMTVDGAGFTARSEDLMNGGDDTWSRPSDVAVAPDGSLYIADWYDPGVGGHQMGDPEGGAGRIYRLAPAKNRPQAGEARSVVGRRAHGGVRLAESVDAVSGLYGHQEPGPGGAAAAAVTVEAERRRTQGTGAVDPGWPRRSRNRAFRKRCATTTRASGFLGCASRDCTAPTSSEVAKPLLRDRSPQVRREIALLLRDPTKMLPAYA